jgi:hypothetical protein
MASKDLMNNIDVKRGLSPVAAVTNDTAFVSEIVDTYLAESVTFVILTGSLADSDATFTVLFEDGDNSALSDNAAVADTFLIGTEALAGFTFAADNKVFKIGYKGIKRYCRVTITPANNTGNVFIAGVWILGNLRSAPSANPPA